MIRIVSRGALAAALSTAVPAPGLAHVTLEVRQALQDSQRRLDRSLLPSANIPNIAHHLRQA
jgi:hypothetical protein